ncbi:unnamed protein product [Pleuronectes platessa]|uniref:Uncharacterized protein n=1 Tax=Pleuronectes platessa TaxID=8262 RepID=A0A9N7V3G0_PLEPL|nr:unnamed protein product [Pleuronectes platessa]
MRPGGRTMPRSARHRVRSELVPVKQPVSDKQDTVFKNQVEKKIAHRSRGSAPRPAHSLRDTRPELLHVKELSAAPINDFGPQRPPECSEQHGYNAKFQQFLIFEPPTVFPVAIRSRQAEKIDSTPKRSLHGARQPRPNATLQPPVCSALRFNIGVDGSQRIGAALMPRFGVASASGVNPA